MWWWPTTPLLREGIAGPLQRRGFQVVDQAGDAAVLSLVCEHIPDVALIDIRMPPTHRTEGRVAAYAIRSEFVDTLDRSLRGGSVVDPSPVHELLRAHRKDEPLGTLSTSGREVLALLAEGRSNSGIARALWVTEGSGEKHVHHILTKLPLPGSGDEHRVLAVVTFLEAR